MCYPEILHLRAGELVEVRSRNEILNTLDADGRRDALPFMPEMLQHCGKKFRVFKRADKACDTVGKTGSRRMQNAVHLEGLRCDGSAHGNCQAGCLIFWKEAWLKRVGPASNGHPMSTPGGASSMRETPSLPNTSAACTEQRLLDATRTQTGTAGAAQETFSCQATELPKATSYLAWWDVRQYVRDITSGNIGVSELVQGTSVAIFNIVVRTLRHWVFRVGYYAARLSVATTQRSDGSMPLVPRDSQPASPAGGFKDSIRAVLETVLREYPHLQGRRTGTPSDALNLRPGEFVQVKSRGEIEETLDSSNRNRGLLFDVEMAPYCGGTYRVLRRVNRIIDERTGKMLVFSNSCIILDGVVCKGCLSRDRLFCPRSIYSYWREIWLRRIE